MAYLSVSQAARRLHARPRDISDLFYRRQLRDDLCPIVGGRRLIPEDYLDMIATELARTGHPVASLSLQGKEG
jgi:hypothetical protein